MPEKVIEELHAIVHGRVQGVFFRAATRDHARYLGLVGTVKNLPDGEVEVYAQGERTTLEKLINQLKNGPGFVKKVDITYVKPQREFEDFRIVYE